MGTAGAVAREAQGAVQNGRPADARKPLEFCLTIWPRSVPVHLLSARAAWQSGDLPDAETHLNRCIKLQDGPSEAVQLEFLLMRCKSGEVDEVANALFDCVERNHPESPVILETIALAYMRRLQYREAHDCATHWMKLLPNDPKPYNFRGWILERIDDPKGAMKDYEEALRLDPNQDLVRLRVVKMLLVDKKPLEAAAHLEFLRRKSPDSADVLARLGECRYLQGETKERGNCSKKPPSKSPKIRP